MTNHRTLNSQLYRSSIKVITFRCGWLW